MHHHHDKVQALAWHTIEPALLLSASFDRSATIIDVRAPTSVRLWSLTGDAEARYQIIKPAHICKSLRMPC